MPEAIACRRVLTAEGWRLDVRLVLDDDGMILAVEGGSGNAGKAEGGSPLHTVVPGMPNVHSHGFQHLIAGLTGRRGEHGDSFWSWPCAFVSPSDAPPRLAILRSCSPMLRTCSKNPIAFG